MRDIVLEETIYLDFTTRAFATGIPTVLAGTPVLSVLEENNATPITAGVSVSVDRASVVGLNMATIVATAANGYEAGKGYSVYISTGTVGGVSVVGEVVAQFTIAASAAAQDLANGTDGLTALKTGIDDIPTVSEFNARSLVSADYTIVSDLGTVQTADHTAAIADIPTVAEFNARTLVAASYFDPAADTVANVTTVATTTTNTDMRGTDSALLASSAPTNFGDLSISVTTGLVDITQTAADKSWSTAARVLTAPTNITSDGVALNTTSGVLDVVNLANTTTTNTDMRGTDSALLAASINLTGGAVDTVTDVTNQVTADTTAIAGVTAAATNLSKSAIGIEPVAAITGTLSTTQMTTDLTEATDDHYNGRIIVWTSGVLKNQATDITDYTGATKLLTYTATTEAPANTDTFVIV